MVDFTRMASPSTMFSAYASLSATIMLIQTTFYQLVPRPVRDYILNFIKTYFQKAQNHPETFRLIIEETDGISINEIYSAAEVYLCSKTDANLYCLKISKRPKETGIQVRFGESEKIMDFYQGVEVNWRFNREEKKNPGHSRVMGENDEAVDSQQKRSFELSFLKEHKDTVLNSYIPFVLKKSNDIKHMKNVVKLHTLKGHDGYGGRGAWKSIIMKHPTTFDNLAMEKSLKETITDDLDRFLMRKDFYKKVGKAWKRGYLLYGPPGTGKSSLVAAIANYLKFDIYDLELASIHKDSDLRGLLLSTPNRSIIVIEDIDCTVELPDRHGDGQGHGHGHGHAHPYHYMQQKKFTLSGLLNFIDGLWSSCADERIIIFTTNNKDKLDPALLRPGRMDMHISMSYLTIDGFKQLLSTYLNIDYGHEPKNVRELIREIEGLIGSKNVTPAEVAGELMLSDDPEVSLTGLLKFLKRRKDDEPSQVKTDDDDEKTKGDDDGSQVKVIDDDDGDDEFDLDDDSHDDYQV